MDLEYGPTILPEPVDEVTEDPAIIPVSISRSPSQTSIMQVGSQELLVFNSSPTAEARSTPPPKATVLAAWWEGGMRLSEPF